MASAIKAARTAAVASRRRPATDVDSVQTTNEGRRQRRRRNDDGESDVEAADDDTAMAGVLALATEPEDPPPAAGPHATTPEGIARRTDGSLIFRGAPSFRPNLTPKQVLQKGAFGGTYFRPIRSTIAKRDCPGDDYREFPADWFEGLDPATQLSSPTYRLGVNQYGVKSGQTLGYWEDHGWIVAQDPRGWYAPTVLLSHQSNLTPLYRFQWYCRFYMGRRSPDDMRQIARWNGVCGPKGRWKRNIVNKCRKQEKAYNDRTVAPVIRQLLQHWAYELTPDDLTSPLL